VSDATRVRETGPVPSRPPYATGSRSLSHLLRHPSLLLRPPTRDESLADLAAVRAGESRRVACVLAGDVEPWPRRHRQGVLIISLARDGASWRPTWARGAALPLVLPATEATVRDPTLSGHRPADDRFRTVVARFGDATLELDVPAADLPLVLGLLAPAGAA